LIDCLDSGKPTLIGACTGVLAGLIGITPAAGFVDMWGGFNYWHNSEPRMFFGIVFIKTYLKLMTL
jgi:Amt family ammonium transporter